MANTSQAQGSIDPENWEILKINDVVSVVKPDGHVFPAIVDNKTTDSAVIWVRRLDVGSRHLFESRDGVKVRPFKGSDTGTSAASLGRKARR
ncbi:hypothetical protein ACIPY3_21275 [Paenarthrobacter sp. NPDC089714]|uniref:hypothetical protein n=1 Tax=Paenarthrobacter sp. NPDC089714 TaxID=3364377 RepID=UPI00380D6705